MTPARCRICTERTTGSSIGFTTRTLRSSLRAHPTDVDRRLGGGKSRRCAVLRIVSGGEDTPKAPRAFADPLASLVHGASSPLH